ncbi:MAG: threonine aldolase family protein, partial [Achromobacter sp.]
MTQRTPADLPSAPVDLRSDTVTHPTAAMYERMRTAPIGDDGLDGDPSVRALEAHVAARLGKEAGLFVPSCTMANLLAVLAQTQRNEQVVLESSAHMYTSERGAATFTGLFYQGVSGTDGAMDLNRLDDALLSGGHRLKTSLVAMETSHNNAGGAVLPLDHMQAVYGMANAAGIPVHLDGARLFNAAVALGVPAAEITQYADTVSLCLSKGLSAPVGAVLAGSKAVMSRARTLRRMLGGTQRQSGIMAAAGLEGVQSMTERLVEDHARARRLSDGINGLAPALSATVPQTNIVQVETAGTGMTNAEWVAALQAQGLLTRPWGRTR